MKKHDNKRTKRSGVVAVGLAAILAVSGIFAFMSDHDNAINKFNFTNEDGDSSIDIQLSETEWEEENGKDIVYGTPVAKNPVATNLGTNEMYAFATVILPAKGVTVQNSMGQIVDVADTPITDLAAAGITRVIANNVSGKDKIQDDDETEILGVFKDADLEEEYEFSEVIEDGATIYFKLNATAPLGVEKDADGNTVTYDEETGDPSAPVAYKVLADTVDTDNFTSDILGHQFMLKLEDNGTGNIALRELYALEVGESVTKDDVSGADRSVNIAGAWAEADDAAVSNAITDTSSDNFGKGQDVLDDDSTALSVTGENQVYGRYNYNKATSDAAGWIEITDKLDNATIYIDGAGRVYSAHVFYYSEPLAPEASTVPVFDAVELINVADGQIMEEDDMNIYVETYGIQTAGIDDALSTLGEDATQADKGKVIWDVMTNTTDQNGFDIFGVVKDTQDEVVAAYVDAGQNVDNDYAVA